MTGLDDRRKTSAESKREQPMNRSTGQKPKTGRSPQDAELFATPEGQKYFKWFLTENAEQI